MRRVPLPVLLACTTYTVLLVGCQSTVAPKLSTPPASPALSFEIAGPSRIDANGPFSWDAIAFGGSGQYQYRWEVTRQAGQQPTTTTTGRKLSLVVTDTDGDMVLRLTVTSGDQTRAVTLAVRNCIGGCNAGP
jgi:hypothetical protein